MGGAGGRWFRGERGTDDYPGSGTLVEKASVAFLEPEEFGTAGTEIQKSRDYPERTANARPLAEREFSARPPDLPSPELKFCHAVIRKARSL